MIPDATKYSDDQEYIRSLVEQIKERHGLSQRGTAAAIGVGFTSLKDWMSGRAKWPYSAQFALECLATCSSESPRPGRPEAGSGPYL